MYISLSSKIVRWQGASAVKKAVLFSLMLAFCVLGFTSTASAAGGVGSGGTGSGGSGAGHHTSNGWGWVIYDINSGGPTKGFRNGDSWSNAYNTCNSAGASQVYAHIINDAAGGGMIYNYLSSSSNFQGQFSPGTIVDKGRASAITIAAAEAAYNSLDASLKGGFTFGNNVGWFCYNFAAPPANVNGIKVTNQGYDATDPDINGEMVTLVSSAGTKQSPNQPFFFNGQPTSGTQTISVPNKPGWIVLGTAFCDQQVTTDNCASMIRDPANYAGYTGTRSGEFKPGNTRVFGPSKAGHTYAFRIIYQKENLGPAKIDGIKVTNNGGDNTNRNSAIDGATITINSSCASPTSVSSTSNPFYFNDRPTGCPQEIIASTVPGWSVVGIAFCDQQVTVDNCDGLRNDPETYVGYTSSGSGAFTSGNKRVFGPSKAGHTYSFRVIYKPVISNKWVLEPKTELNTLYANPDDTVYWKHSVTNIGDETASGWDYYIRSSTNTRTQGSTGGPSLMSGRTTYVGDDSGVSEARSFRIPSNAANGTKYCQYVTVSPGEKGKLASYSSAEVCVTVTRTPPPPKPGCEGLPNPSSAYADTRLPHKNVSKSDPGTTYDDSPNQTHIEKVPYTAGGTTNQETKVTGIRDISSGGSRTPKPTLVSDATFEKATLDYTPYINTYPYDVNQAEITYDSYYSQRVWVSSSSPSTYECRTYKPGLSRSGSTCNYSYTGNPSCPSGYSYNGGTSCSRTVTTTTPRKCTGSGSKRTCTGPTTTSKTYNATASVSCPSGGSPSGLTCSGSYSATPLYRWSPRSWTNKLSESSTVPATTMYECFDRKFDLVPEASNASLNDSENPTAVTVSGTIRSGALTANEHGSGYNLRDDLEVNNFPMNGVYYAKNLAGAVISPEYSFSFGAKSVDSNNPNTRNHASFSDTYGSSVSTYRPPSATLSGPPLAWGDQICFRVDLPSGRGLMDRGGSIQSTASGAQSGEMCSDRVGNKPYFKVFGGDISAGGSFQSDNVCSTGGGGAVTGQYRNGVGGAASELGVLALMQVNSVASASMRTSDPRSPSGLTFANTTAGSLPSDMGGHYATGVGYCAPDYYTAEQYNDGDDRKGTSSASSIDVSGLVNDRQTVVSPAGGKLRIFASSAVNTRHTLFVNGDVQIINDINYATGPWADVKAIPYLSIIAKGDISIDDGVSAISGLYIAQPRTNPSDGGRIYTCTYWQDSNVAANTTYQCDRKLTITGSFIAQRVVMQRTTGTITLAPNHGGTRENISSPNVGEVFQFSPELYLGQPVFKPKTTQYDSIKGLPPVL